MTLNLLRPGGGAYSLKILGFRAGAIAQTFLLFLFTLYLTVAGQFLGLDGDTDRF